MTEAETPSAEEIRTYLRERRNWVGGGTMISAVPSTSSRARSALRQPDL